MADKFGRNYLLRIQSDFNNEIIEIKPPFTVEFDIERTAYSSSRAATIRIFNLSKDNRSKIRHDMNSQQLHQVYFDAGYGDSLSPLLNGNVTQAWSVREGNNFVTTISAFEGGYAFTNASLNGLPPFPKGTSLNTIIRNLIDLLIPYHVTPGAIGDIPGVISKPMSLTGGIIDNLKTLSGGAFFIDNGKANIITQSQSSDIEIFEINASTGLLGTPVRELTFFNFEMLFEPRLSVGQLVRIKSATGEDFDSICKVNSLLHRGMVSETVCGDATTQVGVLTGNFVSVPQVTQ